MSLFLPQRWRQQPLGPVGVDWAHPLARNLRGFAMWGRLGTGIAEWHGTATGLPVSGVYSTVNSRPRNRRYGFGAGWSTSTAIGLRLLNRPILTGTSFTIMIVGNLLAGALTQSRQAISLSNDATNYRHGIDPSAGGVYANIQGRITTASGVRTTGPYTVDSAVRHYAYSHTDGAKQTLYVDGTSVAETTFAESINSAGNYFGVRDSNTNMSFFWAAVVGHAVSGEELLEWRDNPYQIFRQTGRTFYSLPDVIYARPSRDVSNSGWVQVV